METPWDYFMISMKLLGALSLLIFGMKMMSDALQKMAGSQLRHVLARMTSNRISGMLTGTFVTCAVQSSSATTVMTVSFVSAGLLTLSQAISVIMGANIGTTLTAWIISLGYNVDLITIVFPAFLAGIILIYNKRYRSVGDLLFGTAFLFLSLVFLSQTGKELDLANNKAVVDFFASFDINSYWTILSFLAIGTTITCIVQSSAAMMAITILLCSTGVLPIYLGIALVMGENIGTTATANLAALGANTQARRAALAHLLFNVFGVIWVLCVFFPFVELVCSMVGYDPTAAGHEKMLPVVLSMFHTCFNVTNTAVLIGFIPQMERIVCWILPEKNKEKQDDFRLQYIHSNLIQTPEIAILQAQKETAHFGQFVQGMFSLVRQLLEEKNEEKASDLYNKLMHEEDISDKMELSIARFLGQVSENHLSDDTKMKVRQMIREISELESIGDVCYHMARTLNRRQESGPDFTPALYGKLRSIMQLTEKALTQMNHEMSIHEHDDDMRETYRIENEINNMRQQLKDQNFVAVDNREYEYTVGTMFSDIVGDCEKLGDYVVNVVQARLGK
ncbi:MAG: Na/Pi cotransporter family protein [Bacteroidaceae bacterium]|nr:Na/Pi cotransporter family protein [Bacteroidaceae bacterium]